MAEVYPTDFDLELEFSAGVWTDVLADTTEHDPLVVKYGIRGSGPVERVGHAGTMVFSLDNSAGNSGAAQGYYSPDHGSVRSGFEVGIGARLKIAYGGTDYYKGRGRLHGARPEAGQKGLRITHCEVQDWMAAASEIRPQGLDVQESATADSLITALLAAIEYDPPATDLDAGVSTFAYTWDDLRDGNTTAYEIMRAAILSEFGYLTQIGDTTQGGTLQLENRHARVKEATVLVTLDDDGDDDDFVAMELQDTLGGIWNVVRAEAYPRTVDANPDQVLWTLTGDAPSINPDETIEMTAKYTDPDQRVSRVAGLDLQDPEGDNQVANRGFETDALSWGAVGLGVIIRSSASQARVGSKSMELDSGTYASVRPSVYSAFMTGMAQNDVLYWQVYLRIPDTWQDDLEIVIYEYDSSDVYQTTQTLQASITTPEDSWVRYAGTVTLSDADTAKVKLGIRASATGDYSGGAVQAYIDEVYLIHDSDLNFGSSGDESELELVDSDLGGNSGKFLVKNTGASAITLQSLQVVGKRVLTYQPALAIAEDATSKTSYGERILSLPLPYQDDPLEAQDFADITLANYKDADLTVKSVSFWANRSATLMTAFLQGEPGKRISLIETVGGINDEYFINGVEFEIHKLAGGIGIFVTWFVEIARTSNYWILGTSKLGTETVLAF